MGSLKVACAPLITLRLRTPDFYMSMVICFVISMIQLRDEGESLYLFMYAEAAANLSIHETSSLLDILFFISSNRVKQVLDP